MNDSTRLSKPDVFDGTFCPVTSCLAADFSGSEAMQATPHRESEVERGGAMDATLYCSPPITTREQEEQDRADQKRNLERSLHAQDLLTFAGAVLAGERDITIEEQAKTVALAAQWCTPFEQRLIRYGIGVH